MTRQIKELQTARRIKPVGGLRLSDPQDFNVCVDAKNMA